MSLNREHLAVLACPRCHGVLQETTDTLSCAACRVAYPVEDGIPVLLVARATALAAHAGGEGHATE